MIRISIIMAKSMFDYEYKYVWSTWFPHTKEPQVKCVSVPWPTFISLFGKHRWAFHNLHKVGFNVHVFPDMRKRRPIMSTALLVAKSLIWYISINIIEGISIKMAIERQIEVWCLNITIRTFHLLVYNSLHRYDIYVDPPVNLIY